jgi:hypothetical protein
MAKPAPRASVRLRCIVNSSQMLNDVVF